MLRRGGQAVRISQEIADNMWNALLLVYHGVRHAAFLRLVNPCSHSHDHRSLLESFSAGLAGGRGLVRKVISATLTEALAMV